MHRIILLLMIVLTSLGCSKKGLMTRPTPRVSIAEVEQRDVPIYLDAIGQVISTVTVQVRPQVQGKLLEAFVEQGSLVKAGDLLYKVDPRPYIAVLEEAKAQLLHDQALLEYAEKTVERYKTVVEDDFISKLTYEQYESNAAAARAQVELDKAAIFAAQINVDFCDIVAPVSGKISYWNLYAGDIVIAYDTNAITTIRPFDPIEILFSIPQQQLEQIRRVQGNEGRWPFCAILPESPDHKIEGTTYFIDDQVNQDTGTILLKGRVDNESWKLWPGEFVAVGVLYRTAPQAFVVPPGAVLIGKDGPYIYTIDAEGKAQPQNVEVLTRTNTYIALQAKQLKQGDHVITDGQVNIAPGAKVEIATNSAK